MNNLILITEDIAIQSDARNWEIAKRKQRKSKKTNEMEDEWVGFSFHSNLAGCVKALGEHLLRTSGSKTPTELIRASPDISAMMSQKFTASATVEIKDEYRHD